MTPPPEDGDENGRRYREDTVDILRRIEVRVAQAITKIDIVIADYVSKSRFMPVERLVYGLVGLILAAVVGALLGAYQIKVFH